MPTDADGRLQPWEIRGWRWESLGVRSRRVEGQELGKRRPQEPSEVARSEQNRSKRASPAGVGAWASCRLQKAASAGSAVGTEFLEARVAFERRERRIDPEPAGRELVWDLEQRLQLV